MKPKQKAIWICSSCGNGHARTTRKDAEECCVCPGCGKSNSTPGGGRVYCATCTALSDLERAQERLESEARHYASTCKKVTEALGDVPIGDLAGKVKINVERKKPGRYDVRFKP